MSLSAQGPDVLPQQHNPAGLLSVSVDPQEVLSALADVVAGAGHTSKAALARATGLPRSTVGAHVDWLLEHGVLKRTELPPRIMRGRPADGVAIEGQAGWVLCVELGSRRVRLAAVDLFGHVMARKTCRLDVRQGPEQGVERLAELILEIEEAAMAKQPRRPESMVCVLGLPARIESSSKSPLRPTIMPSWDSYPVGAELEQRLGMEVILENDCNVRALAEASVVDASDLPLIAIKVGTGIGAGIIDRNGAIFLGANGSAGDVGHLPHVDRNDNLCSCGARGCVEAVAAIPAMMRQLRDAGKVPDSVEDFDADHLVELLKNRDADALDAVRTSAEAVGYMTASLCNVLNPKRIVINSDLLEVSHEMLAGIRSVVYDRARPLATQNLVIDQSRLGRDAGIAGAFLLGRQHLLSPEQLGRLRSRPS